MAAIEIATPSHLFFNIKKQWLCQANLLKTLKLTKWFYVFHYFILLFYYHLNPKKILN